VNVSKAKLEGLFADELALLQPTAGYMRLLKESVLRIWKARKAALREELDRSERAAKAIQDKLNRLDEAFLFERSIDIETYDRHAEKLRQELTLARIDRHSGQLEELDVEGVLAFAERVLPRAADLWVQASLEQRQRFQQLFFPDGIAFDGNRFVRTGATASAFSYLGPIDDGNERVVAQTGVEPFPYACQALWRARACHASAPPTTSVGDGTVESCSLDAWGRTAPRTSRRTTDRPPDRPRGRVPVAAPKRHAATTAQFAARFRTRAASSRNH
jgi:hypothetical protein